MDRTKLESILQKAQQLKIMVIGDYFLDHYLFIDPDKKDISRETGKPVHQVVRVESSPGAAGSVVSNLTALGVGNVAAVGAIGRDAYGHQLKMCLQKQGVDVTGLVESPERVTPTYIKPTLEHNGCLEELNRMDIKNWTPTPAWLEEFFVSVIAGQGPSCDALIVLDQVEEEECGVITAKVRAALKELGAKHPELVILVDSRRRIGQFTQVIIKPNELEASMALGVNSAGQMPVWAVETMYRMTGRPVFLTCGERGQWAYDGSRAVHVPALPVTGPIDTVGAGDSVSAGIAVALAAGAAPQEAAFFGNLVASVTITKIGTTGTASPHEIFARFDEHVHREHASAGGAGR